MLPNEQFTIKTKDKADDVLPVLAAYKLPKSNVYHMDDGTMVIVHTYSVGAKFFSLAVARLEEEGGYSVAAIKERE
jgi:hypothetical protein